MARTSKYLEGKAQNLRAALLFFIARDKEDRLMSFLDQLSYWSWEMDELLYSFISFDERAKQFESSQPGKAAENMGLMLKRAAKDRVKQDRRWDRWKAQFYGREDDKVQAPTDELRATVDLWNDILTQAEHLLEAPEAVENARQVGVKGLLSNLDSYRRAVPDKE